MKTKQLTLMFGAWYAEISVREDVKSLEFHSHGRTPQTFHRATTILVAQPQPTHGEVVDLVIALRECSVNIQKWALEPSALVINSALADAVVYGPNLTKVSPGPLGPTMAVFLGDKVQLVKVQALPINVIHVF